MCIHPMFAPWAKTTIVIVLSVVVLAVFSAQPSPAGKPAGRSENGFPSFGTGGIDVRVYANYFCGPCRSLEPLVEPLLQELVEDGSIRLTFIDVPLPSAIPYIEYYLYAMNENSSMEKAFHVRGILFNVAANRGSGEDVREALEENDIGYAPYDLSGTFRTANDLLRSDQVRSTPSAVISRAGNAETYRGGANILVALEDLQQENLEQEEPTKTGR